MPFINVNMSAALKPEQKDAVKATVGELISLIPGKEEASTMVEVTGGCALYMGGKPLANGVFIDARIYGSTDMKSKEAFTEALFDAFEKKFGVAKTDFYMNFFEMANWGVKGKYV